MNGDLFKNAIKPLKNNTTSSNDCIEHFHSKASNIQKKFQQSFCHGEYPENL